MVYGACDKWQRAKRQATKHFERCAEWFDRCAEWFERYAEWLAVIDKIIFSVVLFYGGMALISILQNLQVNLAW